MKKYIVSFRLDGLSYSGVVTTESEADARALPPLGATNIQVFETSDIPLPRAEMTKILDICEEAAIRDGWRSLGD